MLVECIKIKLHFFELEYTRNKQYLYIHRLEWQPLVTH